MIKALKKSYSLLLVSFCINAFSLEVELTPGQPIKMILPDGRVAIIGYAPGRLKSVVLPFEISENTCTPGFAAINRCEFRIKVRQITMALNWAVHPNPSKIGTTVIGKYKTKDPRPFLYPRSLKMVDRFYHPKASADIPMDEVVCENYSWLPEGTREAPPQTLRVERWDAERMLTNPETGLTENRVASGLLGAHLEKTSQNTLIFSHYDYVTGILDGIYEGDILAWVLKQKSLPDLCLISLKLDTRALFSIPDPIATNFDPYVLGQNEFSDLEHPQGLVEDLLVLSKDSEGWEFE